MYDSMLKGFCLKLSIILFDEKHEESEKVKKNLLHVFKAVVKIAINNNFNDIIVIIVIITQLFVIIVTCIIT